MLSTSILAGITALAEKYNVRKVLLFGSRARGDFRLRSDIDLAVLGGNAAEFAVAVDEEVETLLKFDVVDLNQPIQPELRSEIETYGVVIYEKV